MIIDLDDLFPEGLSDETIRAITDLLHELVMQWESHYLQRLYEYRQKQQLDLFDPDQPWLRKSTD
jgi:hypothetical protein